MANSANQGDRELLQRARQGDQSAVEELLRRHEDTIFRFGVRMCGNEHDAQDVLQETLLAAFKGLRDFRGDAQLSTWLYQIARSFCVKARRGPAPPVPLEESESAALPSHAEGPEANAHAREIGQVLQAAILGLPEQQREVIVLRDVEGLPVEEAARVCGLDVPAFKSRLHRARLALRKQLSAVLGGAEGTPTCTALAQELAVYAEADVDRATCARIEEHLARCPACSEACAHLKRTVSLCASVPGELPQPVRAAVRAALRAAAGQQAS